MTKRPFIGSGYLNLDLRAVGIDAKRFVRVVYGYTPSWRYFDDAQGKEIEGKAGIDIALDTRPRRPVQPVDHEATKDLVWFSFDILLVKKVVTVGLLAVMPPSIVTYSPRQTFYFDSAGLQRRLDYDAIDTGGPQLTEYFSAHQRFSGVMIPTLRRSTVLRPQASPEVRRSCVDIEVFDAMFE